MNYGYNPTSSLFLPSFLNFDGASEIVTIMNSSFNEYIVYSCNINNFLGKFCFVSKESNNTSNFVNIKKFGIYF